MGGTRRQTPVTNVWNIVYTFEEFLTDNKETQEYDSELYIK